MNMGRQLARSNATLGKEEPIFDRETGEPVNRTARRMLRKVTDKVDAARRKARTIRDKDTF